MATRRELASSLTQAGLLKVLSYDPETGVLRWVSRVEPGFRRGGKVAGRVHRTGYVTVKLDGEEHAAHRLIWLMMTGSWPEHDVDHIDRDRSNNSWRNLREASRRENRINSTPRVVPHGAGIPGVWLDTKTSKWLASINPVPNKTVVMRFTSKRQAINWRLAQEKAHYGAFAPSAA